MRLIKKIKKGTAVILSTALMAGLVPFMPHSVSKVQAAAGSKEPSVTAYATKEQLMDKTFTPNYKGISDIVGKLAFGNDEDGNIQEWYILGKDGGVNNVKDNTIIFAADSIKKEQIFEDISSGSTTKTYKEEYGNYGNNAPQEVYASHYGASELRKVLQDMVRDDNDTYFSDAEKAIMNEVKVTTEDSDYKRYTISDKLYAPGCDSYNYLSHKELLIAVNTNTKKIASSIYWAVGEPFWTRTPRYGGSISELTANPYEIQNSYRIEGHDVNEKLAVRPLANLNLATVLFASSATAATSDSAVYGTIAEGTAMRLRINGKNKDIGSVYYNFENGYIRATKGSISDTVSLVIQGNDGTNDWYYSKKIDKTDTVKVSDIQRALNISDDIDWRNCQIWLETTDEDRMTYAVPAEISTVFATKDQLMDSVLHYDGTPDCIGKLELGKNEDGAYSWYILGKDNNIDGDNTVIFTVSPLATGIKFNPDNNDVTFQEGMGTYTYYDYVPTTVSSDHYGACELRQNLLSIADSSRFTATEKSLMQATTLNMWDTLNSDSYTVSDKLYVPGGGYGDLDIKIGTFDKIILPMRIFWNNSQDSAFWLRTADTDHALIAVCGDKVGSRYFESAENVCAVRAASNLNLSSVLFASSATAFYSQTDEATFSPAEGYVLAPYTKIFINGREFVDEKVVDKNGIISVTGGFESDKRKITTIKKPVVPADNTFTQYYTDDSILDSNDELGNTAGLSFDGSMEPVTGEIDVTWTLEGDYNDSPSAENTFRWSFDVSKLEDYEIAVGCETTGIAVIKNKAATPVSITGTDTGLEYDESDIDVSQYFTIDSNAGTAVYSLVSKETDGSVTGEGTLDGSILNIKNTGIFKVKVITAANGNYAAGEAVITLTVENGTILYNATDYSGTYDGKPHSISVDVTSPSSTNVTYSTDGKTYSTNNPVFTDVGEYTVCYKIEKSNYDTVTGEKKVVIAKKDLEVKVDDQKIVWGNDIDNTKYNVSGLTEGDGISEITLKAGTTALTDNGTISVSSIAITNGSKDVTSNYDIALSDGKLVIEHNTSLAPTRLDAHKKKTAYEAGEILNVDDITVTAYYEDGYSEQITAYTTNADELDMNTVGEKILAVSYTKNGDTKTCRFKIIVTHTHGFDNAVWHSDSINHWKECTKSYCDKSDGYKIQEISHTCEYTYTWSDDYKTCTAVRKCSICEYTDSETAASDIVVVQNRDCTNPEIIEYVARFKNSLYNDFETQIKGNFEAAPATGHNMSEWTSNRDNTHSRICTNSGCTYKETEKCSGGTATYFKKAICDDCKAEHGDFKADTIKPTGEIKLSDNTWNTLLNKITFGRFFSATQKVTIAGTDDSYSSDGFNLSEDAVKISYLIASGDEAKAYTTDELEKRFTAGEFKNYKASFNVNPDNKYVVFARIEDHAGNATYISSDGVVIDSTTPVIDGVAEGEIYCEKVEFTVSDDNFDKVTDIIGDDVQTLTSINGRYILADGMHKVIAYDKAGNSTEVNFVVNANHTVSEWMTDKEATIEETGSRHKECKVCGTILEKADIEKLVPLEYKIIAGADSSWSQNTDMNLVIKGNGDFAKFIRIKVDGVSVDATNYTVAEGSTIITLKPDYIKTLSVGSHVFEIIWKDGIASTSFTIVNNEVADTNNNQGTDITQTGDTAKPVLWSMLFMVSFAGFAVMSGRKKKNCK